LGLIVGINLITSGAAIVMLVLAGENLVQAVAKTAR
jgi:hypothetical protein